MKSRLFVSDAHLNAGWDLRAPRLYDHPFEWLKPNELQNFVSFLRFVARKPDEFSELVFLGDMVDTWIYPIDRQPPSVRDVLRAPHNADAIDALNAICDAGIGLLVLAGNHDMAMTAEDLDGVLPKARLAGRAGCESVFRSGRVRAEHGSAYALFNAPDPINNPRTRLPLGYLISRVIATRAARTGNTGREYASYADDLLECMGPQPLARAVFEALLEEAQISDDTVIQMPGSTSWLAGDVKKRYANLYEQWCCSRGSGMAFKGVMAEISYLDDIADNLCKRGGTNVVIFGHSHRAAYDKDTWFVADRIYANCGSWCDGDTGQFVTTTEIVDKGKRRQQVTLSQWNGDVKTIKSDSVPIDSDE